MINQLDFESKKKVAAVEITNQFSKYVLISLLGTMLSAKDTMVNR